ncbi:MAG: DNA helicase RecQ [Candidatus Krumholzibacteria bacterium]|nr:DNA helicase RecQ [Candidatus Krumholzibacteria bacterium]
MQPQPCTPLELLTNVFGYPVFRGLQAEIIDHTMAGGDSLLLMPTGGGKSLCYQIPAILRPGVGVVVSPLIALMQDQVSALRQLGVAAAFLNSNLAPGEAGQIEGQLHRGELDLIYIAPERLMQERTLDLLDQCDLSLLAIDEAHCISRWGHDFRPEYLQLDTVRERYPDIPLLACTATADERTRSEIVQKLGITADGVFTMGFDRPNISYEVAAKENERQQLLSFLQERHAGDAGIVYCLSRKRTEQIAGFLSNSGLPALPYHAGLPREVRQKNQERFLREDGLIIVATIAFGMGIDKPDVRFVAHLDLPKSIEAYYQETGRAGRDGLPASAWMVYGLQDVIMLRKLAESSDADEMHRRLENQKLDAMLGYCEVTNCRRQVLLDYFNEHLPEPCGNCDTCLKPVETFDATVAAQKALSCVVRTGQRFGAAYIIEVLRGSENERILRFGHNQLPTWGVGGEYDAWQWRSILRQMTARGLLTVDPAGYGGLVLTERARPVLKGQEKLHLRKETLTKPASRKKAKKKATVAALISDDSLNTEANQALFESLRDLRRRLAEEQELPPYVIFHDKTLAAMVVHRPVSDKQFLSLSGVGAAKLERYGEAFMKLIRQDETGSVEADLQK